MPQLGVFSSNLWDNKVVLREKTSETPITVEFPADVLQEIQRIAAEEGWPVSKAVVFLAKLGAKAQRQAEQSLRSAHQAFMNDADPNARDKRGDDMIRAIFGPDAIG